MIDFLFHIGLCPYCAQQGFINIVKKTGKDRLILFCDECYTTWESPQDVKMDKPLVSYEPVGELKDPLLSEIQSIGWDIFIIS
jgi:hypothetical protein